MSKINALFVLFIVALFANFSVQAHQLSTSYISLDNTDNEKQYTGTWQINISDLEQQVALDVNQNTQISWGELKSQKTAINRYAKNTLSVLQNEQTCPLTITDNYQLDNHFNEAYLVLPLVFSCNTDADVTLTYRAFFNQDANHKVIVNVNQVSRVFTIDEQQHTFTTGQSSYLTTFNQYVYQGVLHIWIGIDHILFLIALLLTCVLTRNDSHWQAIASKKHIIKHTAWIVTAFTLAHSLTLTATALNLVSPSSRWVELGIAISVLFAALNNVWPVILRLGWLTFAFGLLHGMGFASVLGELGLSSDYQLLSILAFNLGVELGQLSILCIALPVLLTMRNKPIYIKWVMPIGSLAIAAMAILWCVERI